MTHVASLVGGWTMGADEQPTSGLQWRIAAWATALVHAYPTLSTRAPQDRRMWLEQFSPSQLGFDEGASLPRDIAWGEIPLQFGEEQPSVGQLWSQLVALLEVPEIVPRADQADPDPAATLWSSPRWVAIRPGGPILLSENQSPHPERAKWFAAGLLSIAFLVAYILGGQLRGVYWRTIAAAPWLWWLQLALVALLLFPTVWPATLLFACAMLLALGHWSDRRKGVSYR